MGGGWITNYRERLQVALTHRRLAAAAVRNRVEVCYCRMLVENLYVTYTVMHQLAEARRLVSREARLG